MNIKNAHKTGNLTLPVFLLSLTYILLHKTKIKLPATKNIIAPTIGIVFNLIIG